MPGRCPARAAADVCKSYILCKIPQNRLYFLGYYAIIKIQQAEREESAMQTTRRLAVLTVLAAVLIAAVPLLTIHNSEFGGAVPHCSGLAAAAPCRCVCPGGGTHCRAGGTDPHRHQHGHGGGTDRPAGPWPPEGRCARSLPRGARPVCHAGGRRCGQGHIPAHDRKLGGPGRCQSLGGDTLGKKAGKHLHQP